MEFTKEAQSCPPLVMGVHFHSALYWEKNTMYSSVTEQGGRCWGTAGPAVPERSGSSPKGRTPNIRYFVAKLSNVAIYALYERPT